MKDKVKPLIELHILLLIYSLGGFFSKLAGLSEFLSLRFVVFYSIVFMDLVVYAILWQQMLKKLPLVTAYANKAITVIWGIVWGMLFFKEKITVNNILGALIIIFGICMVVKSDE